MQLDDRTAKAVGLHKLPEGLGTYREGSEKEGRMDGLGGGRKKRGAGGKAKEIPSEGRWGTEGRKGRVGREEGFLQAWTAILTVTRYPGWSNAGWGTW